MDFAQRKRPSETAGAGWFSFCSCFSALPGQHVNGVQPDLCCLGPCGDGKLGAAQSVTMSALRINVQFGWYLGVLEGEEIDDRVFYVDRIVLRLNEEGGRSLSSWVNIRVGSKVLIGEGEIGRVDNDGKVRAATELVRSVDRVIEPLV